MQEQTRVNVNPGPARARAGKLTASAVGALMSGNEKKILKLWRELVGDPDFEREDLSGVWAVQLGSVTEQLNLDWYERRTGHPVTKRGEVAVNRVENADPSPARCARSSLTEEELPMQTKRISRPAEAAAYEMEQAVRAEGAPGE